MSRQPHSTRGQSSGIRLLCVLYPEPRTRKYSRQGFNTLPYQAKRGWCIPWVKKRVMVSSGAAITLSLSLIYTSAEPQGQQITHVIKFKSPHAGNRSSPARQVHWPLLQPLRLWRFPPEQTLTPRPGPSPVLSLLHVLLTYGSNKQHRLGALHLIKVSPGVVCLT